MDRDHRRPFVGLLTLGVLCLIPVAGIATTTTPSFTPTRTATCGSTATPYCADQCVPCPTIRAGCYAGTCGECHQNPVCGAGEACAPEGLGGCCACATFTPTPLWTPTEYPTPAPSCVPLLCAGDCNGDRLVTVDELVAAVRVALGESAENACASFDGDGDGSVSVNELVTLVVNALVGCIEMDLSGVVGVYDAQASGSTRGGPGLAVIERRGNNNLRIDADFGIGESLGFDARQVAHGRFELAGGGITAGDLAYRVQGNGTLTKGTDGSRFVAAFNVGQGPTLDSFTVTLERPAAGTPPDYSGYVSTAAAAFRTRRAAVYVVHRNVGRCGPIRSRHLRGNARRG